ncbi:MAG: DUF3667 domain-containing protein [Pseudomonadota bacterium]
MTKCPNCGALRTGPYCGQCGQNDRDYQRALPPLMSELISEAFEVDSRLVRTLKLLLFKPGELAAEFSRNRRASYVSPIRLYLFVSILFFFFLSLNADVEQTAEERVTIVAEAEAMEDTDTKVLRSRLGAERLRRVEEILARPDGSLSRLLLLQLAQGIEGRDSESLDEGEVFILRELIDALYEPGSVISQFADNLAIGMFFMLPIYALLLKLFYFSQHRFYVETLVFSTHLHSFAFLVLTTTFLFGNPTGIVWVDAASEFLESALSLWIAVYHYLALRRYFGGGHVSTLFKYTGLVFLYFVLLMPTAFLLVLAFTVLSV